MILILSASADVTVRGVRRWLARWGHESLQVDDDDPIVAVDLQLDDDHRHASFTTHSGRCVDLAAVEAVWNRRGALTLDTALLGPPGPLADARAGEWLALRSWLEARLDALPHLGSLRVERRFDKLTALEAARAVGLSIPPTCVSCDRSALLTALERWDRGIHKGLHAGVPAEEEPPEVPATTTRELTRVGLQRAPRRVFPRLAQARVDKRVELRVAYLAGQLWALAMVPRDPSAQPVDVRVVDLDARYHLVPYALPEPLPEQLRALMQRLDLDTGSIDLLVDGHGRHLFLEVNPSGQLDWLREACNVPIERRFAEHLAALAAGQARSPLPERARAARREPPPPDPGFAEAQHRFARVAGQQVLVRPLAPPILRPFPSPGPAPAASHPEPGTPAEPRPSRPGATPIVPANLAIVEGRDQTLIYDLQRGRALRPSPALVELLEDPQTSDDEARLALATRAGLLAWVDDPERYPSRSLDSTGPAPITNVVIDVDGASTHDFPALFAELATLGCEHMLVRVAHARGLELLDTLMVELEDGPPLFVECWLVHAGVSRDELIDRVARWPRITTIVVFETPPEAAGEWQRTRSGVGRVTARTEALDLGAPCRVEPETLVVHDALFRAAQTHAPMIHRKLAIGTRGELRNAPHLARSFGRLGERSLGELAADPAFCELGAIDRGSIEGCRACAYRFACTDGRVPRREPDGLWRLSTPCALGPAIR